MKFNLKNFYFVLLVCGAAFSGGPLQAIEVQTGTRAQSMAVAFAAVADDPSAVLHNPAGLTQIEGSEVDLGFGAQFVGLDYWDANGNLQDTDEIALVPHLFFSTDKVKPVVLGVGFYSPFGSAAEIEADTATGFRYAKSEISRTDLTVAAAIKLGPVVSIGLGATLGYAKFANDVPLGPGRLEESASGWGVSGVAGLTWNPHKRFQLGVSYQGPMHVKTRGEANVAGTDDEFSTNINFPGTLKVGIAVKPIEMLTVSFQHDWTHWDVFEVLERDYDNLATINQRLDGHESHDYRIGFEVRPWERTHFRAGYSYQQTGWPSTTISPTQLDYNTQTASIGVSQYFWKMRVDLGYEASFAFNREEQNNLNGYSGNYDATRHIALATLAFAF